MWSRARCRARRSRVLLDLDIPVEFIRGNGEAAALAHLAGTDAGTLPEQAREAVRWSAKQLPPEDERLLASWPATLRIEIPGLGDVLFCHATPRSDTEIFTRLTPEERLFPVFEGLDVSVIVCGHTHMQFDRTIGRIRVVNAGSVGMPFGEPGAYWLLLGPDVQLRRTPYDLAKAAERIRDTNYPQARDFAAQSRPATPVGGSHARGFQSRRVDVGSSRSKDRPEFAFRSSMNRGSSVIGSRISSRWPCPNEPKEEGECHQSPHRPVLLAAPDRAMPAEGESPPPHPAGRSGPGADRRPIGRRPDPDRPGTRGGRHPDPTRRRRPIGPVGQLPRPGGTEKNSITPISVPTPIPVRSRKRTRRMTSPCRETSFEAILSAEPA